MRSTAKQLVGSFVALAALLLVSAEAAYAQTDKPNILIIWGDDIGIKNKVSNLD